MNATMTDFSHLITDEAVEAANAAIIRAAHEGFDNPSDQQHHALLAALPHIIAALDKEREAQNQILIWGLEGTAIGLRALGKDGAATLVESAIRALGQIGGR